jgi:hypothetical protein
MAIRVFAVVGLSTVAVLATSLVPVPVGAVGAGPKAPSIVSPIVDQTVRAKPKPVAKPKLVATKRAAATKKKLPTRTTPPTTRAVSPTTLAPVVTAAPTTIPATPATTVAPTPATTAVTTTPPAAIAPFDVVSVNTRADVAAGATATFSVVLGQRGAANSISLSVIGLPAGMSASIGPNPATGLATVRIATPTNAVPADYPLRILGVSTGGQAWANVTLGVGASATTTTPVTTTIDTSAAVSFGFSIMPDGKTLVTGGQVQYEITPIYETGSNGSIEFFVSGLPDGVWHGFSEKVTTTKTTLWLSSTVPLKSGRYTFTITGVAKGLKKAGEVTLVIG